MAITLTKEQFEQRYGQQGISKFNVGSPVQTPQPQEQSFLGSFGDILKERGSQVSDSLKRFVTPGDQTRRQTGIETKLQVAGDVLGAAGDLGFEALKRLTPDSIKNYFGEIGKEFIDTETGKQAIEALQAGSEMYGKFKEANPRDAATLEAMGNIIGSLPSFKGAYYASDVAKGAVGAGKDILKKGVKSAGELATGAKESGVGQLATELAERAPRALEKGKQAIQEASARSTMLKNAPLEVKNAIKSNLDSRIIATVTTANNPTISGYKKMVDIAKSAGNKLGLKTRPEIVAGDVASVQYKLIDNQRKAVGEMIGNVTRDLSKTQKVDITSSIDTLKEMLGRQGVKINGKLLDFTGTGFTTQERSKIKELFKLTTESGTEITPYQIYKKDQLFSKLQREARFEGLDNIFVETLDGNKNLFGEFRDVFNSQLDNLSPEIKDLNKQYRELRVLVDDVENSIVKGGKFNATKGVDPAEFAQTNLRRLLSDAQSAGAYRTIVSKMDEVARGLGYEGANAEDLIAFATELRKLYPDAIPATGFTGGIKTGFKDIIGQVANIGKPQLKDQQKALEELLQSLTGGIKKEVK